MVDSFVSSQHDVYIKNLTLDLKKVPFPVPPGDYIVKTTHYINNETTTAMNVAGKII